MHRSRLLPAMIARDWLSRLKMSIWEITGPARTGPVNYEFVWTIKTEKIVQD